MPILNTKAPKYKPEKDIETEWDNFRGGLNTLLRETELKDNELAQADNLMLTGLGVPTKRWGTDDYFLAGAAGAVRGLGGYYHSGGSVALLALTDDGYLTKKSGASYSIITGASWASGYYADMAQLDNNMYIVNETREMVKTDAETITSFPTIAQPTGVVATQMSGASGTTTKSYRISVTTDVGETLATTSTTVGDQPQDLTDGAIKVTWTAPSAASGTLVAFNVYGRDQGYERFLGSVDWQSTTFIDNGDAIPQEFTFPPTADTTGGVNCKYIERFQDRLIYAGIEDEPNMVVISGRVPLHESVDISYGGNYIKIEPDAGDVITGLKVFEDKIIVFKERSIWQVSLSTIAIGNFYVTVPTAQLITQSYGCIASRTIAAVENDLFFLGRDGVYVLGYEPNILNVLRTNEISVKVQPYFEALTTSELEDAAATYYNNQYIITFPGHDDGLAYDRERTCWMGPWTIDPGVFETYYDDNNDRYLLYGSSDSANVYEMSADYGDDDGTAISTILRTKKENYKDWSIFKTIKDIFWNFRNVTGDVSVNVRIEGRDGTTTTAESFAVNPVTGNSGWGADLFGDTLFGDSEATGGSADTSDIVRWLLFNKSARTMQVEIKTDNRNDNYELLSVRSRAKPISRGYNPSSWRV